MSDSKKVADIMVDFFSNVVETLNIPDNTDIISNTDHTEDNVEQAIGKYANHPSITKIKNCYKGDHQFRLTRTTVENVKTIILNKKVNKSTPKNGIPTNFFKINSDLFAPFLCKNFMGYMNVSFLIF